MQEVDTYYHINIVETLAWSRYVTMLAKEIKIQPNIKPESSKLFGIDVPGEKRYLVTRAIEVALDKITIQIETESKKKFYLKESTVKAAKELIVSRQVEQKEEEEENVVTLLKLIYIQAEGYENNAQASLETVGDDVEDIKKQQAIMHGRVENMEEKLDLILDIMQSRHAPVERF